MKTVLTAKLVALLNGHPEEIENALQWEYVIRVARDAAILPRIAHFLLAAKHTKALPQYALDHLLAAKRHGELLAQQVRFEAAELSRLGPEAGQDDMLFLKGAAYILAGYKVGYGRVFADIDLLVTKRSLTQIERKLLAYGWFTETTDEYEQKYYRQWAHEIPPLRHSGRGTLLDVHHNIVPIISGNAPQIELFTHNRRRLTHNVCILSPASMLLHSAIHLFYQEEYHRGFRDLSDLHLMFCEFAGDADFWSQLIALAQQTHFTLELALAVRYTGQMFDTPLAQVQAQQIAGFLPTRLKLVLLDWMFSRVLQPHHPLCQVRGLAVANALALFRGHWIKMPLHILIKHTAHKTYKSVFNLIAGKGALVKSTNNHP
jgi:hypothetical protein